LRLGRRTDEEIEEVDDYPADDDERAATTTTPGRRRRYRGGRRTFRPEPTTKATGAAKTMTAFSAAVAAKTTGVYGGAGMHRSTGGLSRIPKRLGA
jgi:hypothetical protein